MAKRLFAKEDIAECWGRFATFRTKYDRITRYYEEKYVIPEQKIMRFDKHVKTVVHDSYTKSVTKFHAGYMVSSPVEYAGGCDDDHEAIKAYNRILLQNNIAMVDAEHYRNAFLYGYSIELVYINKEKNVVIKDCDPARWAFVCDDHDVIKIAIRRQKIDTGTIYRGEYIRDGFDVYELFTDTWHIVYNAQDLKKIVKERHGHGFCPVHKITINKKARPMLGSSFFKACDALCKTKGNLSDVISWNVNSLLKIKTTQETINSMMKTDDLGIRSYDKMVQSGTLFLAPEDDAQYLSRDVSVQHFIEDIKEHRLHICQSGSIPDLDALIKDGKITSLSGTALQTLFYQAQLLAEETEPYFAKSLKTRMQMVSKINDQIKNPAIKRPEDIVISCRKRMPLSIEAIQNIANLQKILSREDILRTVPQIDNVNAALAREPMESGMQPISVCDME